MRTRGSYFCGLIAALALAQFCSASSVKTINLVSNNACTARSITAEIVLSTPAALGGQEVGFSSPSSFITVPPPITIPAGTSVGDATITFSGGATADSTTYVSAFTNGSKVSAVLHVYAPRAIKSLTLDHPVVFFGTPATGTITMVSAIPAESVVTLSASGPGSVPSEVTIPANATTAKFTLTPGRTLSNTLITVTASSGTGPAANSSTTDIPGWTYVPDPNGGVSSLRVNLAGTGLSFTCENNISNNAHPSFTVIALTKGGSQSWKRTTALPPAAPNFAPYYGFIDEFQAHDGTIIPLVINNELSVPNGGGLVYPYSATGTPGSPYSIPINLESMVAPAPIANGDLGFYDENGGSTFNGATQTSTWSWPTPAHKVFSSVQQGPDGSIYAKGRDGTFPNSTDFIIRLGQPDPGTHVRPVLQNLITAQGTAMSDPEFAHGNVYVTSHPSSTVFGTLTAMNADLTVRWQFSPGEELSDNGESDQFMKQFTTTPNSVVVVSTTKVIAVKPTGVLAWQIQSLDPHSPNATGNFDNVFGAPNGTLYDLNAEAGGSPGTLSVRAFTPGGSQKWRTNFTNRGAFEGGTEVAIGPDSAFYLGAFVSSPTNFGADSVLGFAADGSVHFEVFVNSNQPGVAVRGMAFFPDGTVALPAVQSNSVNILSFKWTP